MKLNLDHARACLRSFEYRKLFVEELGWANCKITPFEIRTDDHVAKLNAIAEQGGMVIYEAQPVGDTKVLPSHVRKAIDREVTKRTFEHLIIFINADRTQSVWLWVKREQGKPSAPREHHFYASQDGTALLQKLDGLFFDLDELDDEGRVSVITVAQRVAQAFDIEKITKKFYESFKTEHEKFLGFIKGIENTGHRRWYSSVMLNRIMFIYFIQKKGFLDGDQHYLANRLKLSKEKGKDQFYNKFLSRLFFEGFALELKDRPEIVRKLIGNVPYLNGGLFLEHEVEKQNRSITIPDAAFDRLFTFFNKYQWHLDDRPYRRDNEINPDVLGYIFEKYINQKQMGAYYTKEDITDYICKNTILPFLFDKLATYQPKAVKPLPIRDIEPYIYPTIKLDERLPTETEREGKARINRLSAIRTAFKAGKITCINDFITYNLDITAYAQDYLRSIKDPMVLRAFYFECLKPLSVLDPACGSGAFLFSALNILETLYELCLDKMEEFEANVKYRDFADELKRVEKQRHPNRRYFIFKSIIIGNLYGVDIMEEATEICKLRLFLKLAAETDADPLKDNYGVEPLPDIDFNIQAGNALIGYANLAEVKNSLFGGAVLDRIRKVDIQIKVFRNCQTEIGMAPAVLRTNKELIRTLLDEINDKLDRSLFSEYGAKDLNAWKESHHPFHWYVEFNSIFQGGGFDVIVGNPPYVEYSKIRDQYTLPKGFENFATNLYSACCYRSDLLKNEHGSVGFIVPISMPSTDRLQPLRVVVSKKSTVHSVSFGIRPSRLFDGAEQRLTIYIARPSKDPTIYSGGYLKWYAEERDHLFRNLDFADITTLKLRNGIWGKVRGSIHRSVISKMLKLPPLGATGMLGNGRSLYYKNTGIRYFSTVTLRPPKCWINGKASASSRETTLNVASKYFNAVHCLMLSTTFFVWWESVSNGRDLNPSDIQTFPAPLIPDAMLPRLNQLSAKVEEDYVSKGKIIRMENKKTGLVEIESLTPSKSKLIIDEIDRVLAKHYGFTDEELDFVINYDIKYRMGQGDEEE